MLRVIRRDVRWLGSVLAGLMVATATAFALSRALPHSAATAWPYVPLVLLVTLRWGRLPGIVAALLADVLVLSLAVLPLSSSGATDAKDAATLAVGMVGMVVSAVLVASLNARLVLAERQRVAASERTRAQQRFQALIEHSTDGLQLFGREGQRLYTSPSTTRVVGYTPEELADHDIFASVQPENRAAAARFFTGLTRQPGASRTLEVRIRHKDGSWLWVETTTTNLLDEPSVQAVVVNHRDVTARHRVEDQVRRSRDELATILASVSDGILVQEASGALVYANDAAARLCGLPTAPALLALPPDELLARFALNDAQGQPFPLEQLPGRRVLEGERAAEATVGFRSTDGGEERWAWVTAAPITMWGGESQLVLTVFREITEQWRLAEAQRQAIQVRDQFLSTASHELRTPLTALKAHLQLSLRRLQRGSAPAELVQSLELADAQASRLNRLIGDLLDISRLTSGRLVLTPVPLHLGELCGRIVEAERAIKPEREISCDVADADLWVLGDSLRLEQVLVNLLHNACKYSPEGTPVRVSVRGNADSVSVAVQDEGIGIPVEDQARLFTPFYRATNVDKAVPGLGLGLAIAHDLVQAHGGDLSAVSAPGAGSIFTVTLPGCSRPIVATDSKPAPAMEAPQERATHGETDPGG